MTRFWRVALLTLLIALLPLRGWAWAVMPVPTPGHAAPGAPDQVVSAASHGAHAPAATSLRHAAERAAPCHGHQATTQHATADAHADAAPVTSDNPGTGHTCSLCDLCHAGVIVPPSWAWFHDAPPVSPPSWAVSATHGRDGTDGLFRPPRA
jgi:hypothetical protein